MLEFQFKNTHYVDSRDDNKTILKEKQKHCLSEHPSKKYKFILASHKNINYSWYMVLKTPTHDFHLIGTVEKVNVLNMYQSLDNDDSTFNIKLDCTVKALNEKNGRRQNKFVILGRTLVHEHFF